MRKSGQACTDCLSIAAVNDFHFLKLAYGPGNLANHWSITPAVNRLRSAGVALRTCELRNKPAHFKFLVLVPGASQLTTLDQALHRLVMVCFVIANAKPPILQGE